MRRIHAFALAIALVASSGVILQVHGQAQQPAAAVFAPTTGDYEKAGIRVLTPGVVFSSGLPDLSAAFAKETGKTVGINTVGMGTIVEEIGKRTPPPDMIALPFQLMNSLALEGGVVPGTMVPLGRNLMGLAVKAGAPKPDISTPEKFIAAMKGKAVMRSNPASRTMVATIIDDMFKRPSSPASTRCRAPKAKAARRSRAAKATWRFRRSARFFRIKRSSSSAPCRRNSVCGSTRCSPSLRAPRTPTMRKR